MFRAPALFRFAKKLSSFEAQFVYGGGYVRGPVSGGVLASRQVASPFVALA